jgi:VWFA-related protein
VRILALLLAAATLASSQDAASQNTPAQDDVVFRAGVSLVRVDAEAVVTSGPDTGKVIPGLTKEDFRVLDQGQEQKIVSFSFAEEPLDLILLFDTGGSMKGKLLEMLRATELGFYELKKGDRVCVRNFASLSQEVLPFTDNLETVNRSILLGTFTLKFNGSSRLLPAAQEAAQRFRTEPQTHRKRAILAITDKTAGHDADQAAAVKDLWNNNAVFSELILGRASQTQTTVGDSDAMVEKTGGAAIHAGAPGPAFRDSVHYLRSGYAIYYSQPDAPAGSERSLQVELTPDAAKRYPNVRIRARSGYIVP